MATFENINYFPSEGIIPANMSSLDPTDDFAVNPDSGMDITVGIGEAIVGNVRVKFDTPITLTVSPNNTSETRFDIVKIRQDLRSRICSVVIIDQNPVTVESLSAVEIPLAGIEVSVGATSITSGDITDVRFMSDFWDANPGSATTTLSSAGGDETLVVDGTGPDLEIKGLTAGSNVTISDETDYLEISATFDTVTLTSGTGDESLVSDGTGPDLEIKALSEGSNITLTSDGETVTISADSGDVTLTSGTGDESLVSDGTGPALEIKALSEGDNITLTSDSDTVTISSDSPPLVACIVTHNAGQTVNNSSTITVDWNTSVIDTNSMKTTAGGDDVISIPEDGLYEVSCSTLWTTPASSDNVRRIFIQRVTPAPVTTNIAIGSSRGSGVTNTAVEVSASCVIELDQNDYIKVLATNNSGANCDIQSVSTTIPQFSVIKLQGY